MTNLLIALLALTAGADTPAASPSPTPQAKAPPRVATQFQGPAWPLAPMPPQPPLPDFEMPVDYLAWYRAATAYAADSNALNLYGIFLYGDDNARAKPLAPEADSAAAKDLARMLENPTPWYPEEYRELIEWMVPVERQYAQVVEEATKTPHYASRLDPAVELLVRQSPPALGNARTIGQVLIARAWRVERNTIDADRLAQSLANNLVLARHIGEGATLEEQFFGSGHRNLVYRHIRRALYSPAHTAYQWLDVAAALEMYDNVPVPQELARGLCFFEAAALQLVQELCTERPEGASAKLTPRFNMDAVNAYAEFKYPGGRFRPASVEQLAQADPRELAKVIHAYYDGMRQLLAEPIARNIATRVNELQESTLGAHPELAMIVTPIGLPVQAAFRTEAERRLAYVFLKQAIDFKFTGVWPDALDKIEGARAKESRIDPYSGQDMHLLKVFEAYVPYSVGPDGIDDGGNETTDIVFWGRVSEEAFLHNPKPASTNGLPQDASTNGAGATDASAPRPAEMSTVGAKSQEP